MYFPPVDKRLYYIYCNQLFRDHFRQAPTCPFLHFSKKEGKPHRGTGKAGYLFIRLLKQTAKDSALYLIHSSTHRPCPVHWVRV